MSPVSDRNGSNRQEPEYLAAFVTLHTADRPSSYEFVGQLIAAGKKLLTLANRQLVDVA